MRRYEEFLELMKFDQNLITTYEKHMASPNAEKFIYPFEMYCKDAFAKIINTASIEQQDSFKINQ